MDNVWQGGRKRQFCHTNRHGEMRKLTAKIILGCLTIYYCPIESREGRAFGTLRGAGRVRGRGRHYNISIAIANPKL